MHALKPMKVGILHKMFAFRSEYYFGVEALLYTDFRTGALGSEIGMWKFFAEQFPDATIDEAVPKARGEFYVCGVAHPPGGAPSGTCPVKAVVGGVEKSLAVLGDRVWKDGVPTPPVPFSTMPITWQRAFGGEGFAKNPLGRGIGPIAGEGGQKIHPLPNIEQVGKLVTSPNEKPAPVGFLPMDLSWPFRMKKAGTYDEKWAKERFPGYADDIDWTIFNAAPPDQWAPSFWAPDTEYEFTHLHPSERTIGGKLPGYSARAFAVFGKSAKAGQRWEEVALNLTTLWFFPHLEKVIMGFCGAVKVREDDGTDVDWIVAAAEHADRKKPLEHYQRVMAAREGYEPEAVEARFRDSDLLPEGIAPDIDEVSEFASSVEPEQLLHIHQIRGAMEDWEEGRKRCIAAGVDPDEYLGPCPYTEEDLQPKKKMSIEEAIEVAAQKRREAEEQEAAAQKEQADREAMARQITAEAGVDHDEMMRAAEKDLPVGAPIQWAKKAREQAEEMAAALRAQGWPQAELEAQLADPKFDEKLAELERMQIEAYRSNAHLDDDSTAGIPNETLLEGARAWLESELERKKSFRGRDLTGVDLSNLDLSGADFEGAFLEHANLSGAIVNGTNFRRAVLVRTRWEGAKISRATFEGANLGRAQLAGAVIEGPTDFYEAILSMAELGSIAFTGCRLAGVEISGSDLSGADFAGAEAPELKMRNVRLGNVSFEGANLEKASFEECTLTNVSFDRATLSFAGFHDCRASGCTFVGARAHKLTMTGEGAFDDCDFTSSDLSDVYARGISLVKGCFEAATLDRAELGRCALEGARFDGARGRHLRLSGATLDGASFVKADLMYAALDKARALGTKLDGANLFMADFGMIHSDAETSVAGANTKRAKILPERKRE